MSTAQRRMWSEQFDFILDCIVCWQRSEPTGHFMYMGAENLIYIHGVYLKQRLAKSRVWGIIRNAPLGSWQKAADVKQDSDRTDGGLLKIYSYHGEPNCTGLTTALWGWRSPANAVKVVSLVLGNDAKAKCLLNQNGMFRFNKRKKLQG